MCGVGGWGGVFKDVVVGHVERTWNICVGWGGTGHAMDRHYFG